MQIFLDEVFIVIDGVLEIHFRNSIVTLNSSEMFVIPKGVEHKPVAKNECKIMLVEPKGVVNTGDVTNEYTKTQDEWI
ncbi:hypothetical protein [Arcobacter sp. CECT 8986]|uniref:hypothetical protein n=1 Tax=Arcobacter sp. CECT 8986 TaxID=2044507 RepID=UPI002159D438|nr:hypothetical protein [Arcobacter sp. CECT 8986]